MASSFSSPWPDPNSPVLSKIDFGAPLAELFKWLDVRDTLFGRNFKRQDIAAALALARDCKHPDAVWLASIFEGKAVSTKEDAREVFLLHSNDARALCFAWCFTDDRRNDLSLLRFAVEMGNAFACSTLCWQVWIANTEEAFRLARLAASQHERDGFYWLGYFFLASVGCEKDLNLAKEKLLIAAELGQFDAAAYYGDLLDESDAARWLWLGRAASHGVAGSFLFSFPNKSSDFSLGLEMHQSCF